MRQKIKQTERKPEPHTFGLLFRNISAVLGPWTFQMTP